MTEIYGKWAYSFNNENYTGTFDTREEAIDNAKADVGDRNALPFPRQDLSNTLYVGQTREPAVEWGFFGEHIVDDMQEHMDDIGGEYAETFYEQISDKDIELLDERVNETIEKWVKECGIKAGFFLVESVEEIDITDWYKEGSNGDSEQTAVCVQPVPGKGKEKQGVCQGAYKACD